MDELDVLRWSGTDSSRAERLLGRRARRSWRDDLAADGRLTIDVPASPAVPPQAGRRRGLLRRPGRVLTASA